MTESVVPGNPLPVRTGGKITLLVALLLALTAICILALVTGTRPIGAYKVIKSFTAYNGNDFDHQSLFRFRLPRIVAAIMAGAALALTGALLQVLIRNPLAEPQLLGLNSGAALAVVSATVLGLPETGLSRPILAAIGAFVAFTLVLGLAGMGRSRVTPLKVTLVGIVISAFASAISSALLLIDDRAIEELRLWLAGDLGGQNTRQLLTAAPFIGGGVILALLLSSRLSALSLGDEVARGLGVNVARTRLATLLSAAMLSGAAVTLAGPIGFIGLVVPHLSRRLVGQSLRLQFAICLLCGPILLIVADIIARRLIAPIEIATGIITGAAGALVFIIMAARYFR